MWSKIANFLVRRLCWTPPVQGEFRKDLSVCLSVCLCVINRLLHPRNLAGETLHEDVNKSGKRHCQQSKTLERDFKAIAKSYFFLN